MSQQHYLIGYGSLLSHDSRLRYSDIQCHSLPVSVSGWKRAWVTRSKTEQQTYVGAINSTSAKINGMLIPIAEIDENLRVREQDYEFVLVDHASIDFHFEGISKKVLTDNKIWLCQTKKLHPVDNHHPIYQSYVDTCMAGCLEANLPGFVEQFVTGTEGWENGWLNDRHQPQYPRAAKVNSQLQQKIDEILQNLNVIQYRQSINNDTDSN